MAPVDGLEVRRRVERLLEGYDPATVPAEALWAAQFDAGLAWVHFPVGHGGLGAAPELQRIITDALDAAGAPGNFARNGIGVGMAAPVLEVWADEARALRHLRRIWTCEDIWCQMFSEPGAGSDVASLATRAERDGDEWIVSGQKVWTTLAHVARWGLLLARTDPDAPKHQGLTYFVVDMHAPGVEVRPLRQMTGEAEFNEVFFDGARCPKDNVVGGLNNGWKVANDTLGFERGMSATTGHRRFEEEYKRMVRAAQKNGKIDDPLIRQGLATYYTKIQILRINGLRNLTAALTGKRDMGTATLGATNKMFWSEMHKAAMELALDIYGPESMLITTGPDEGWPGVARIGGRDDYPVSPMMTAFFFSRSETIWGGTSQIQRNIVGEKVLGLPREPKAPTK